MRVLLIIAIACLYLSCNSITERMSHYEVHGIDVSHYQARIDWDTVATQNIDFAFVKATEGKTIADSLFQTNWTSLKRVGIKRGAYHFFRPTTTALDQAKHFIQQVQIVAGDLPPVLDVEVTDGVAEGPMRDALHIWLEEIQRFYQVKPILYTNLKFYRKYIAGYFDDYPVWIARYNTKKPVLGNNQNWLFWQYGDRGELAGIEGFVDFNVFQGSLLDLHNLCVQEGISYQVDYSH